MTKNRPVRHAMKALIGVAAAAGLVIGAIQLTDHQDTGGASATSVMAAPAVSFADGSTGLAGEPLATTKGVTGERVDLVLDGWSYATLTGTKLTWTSDTSTQPQPLNWEPATTADISELLHTTPQIPQTILARDAVTDSTLTCAAAGCRTAGETIPASWFYTAEDVANYGPAYQAGHVAALAYTASIPVPAGDRTVTISGAGEAPISLAALPTTGTKATAANGYYRNRYLLAAAFGHLFLPQTTWDDGSNDPANYLSVGASSISDTNLAALSASAPHPANLAGLAAPWPLAQSMTPSQLTYFSSPTTGCGIGVLCSPTGLPVNVSRDHVQVIKVHQVGNPAHTAALLTEDIKFTTDFTSPTPQYGVWGTTTQDQFPRSKGAAGILGGGLPPLATGQQTIRWVMAVVYDGPTATPRTYAGRVDAGPSSSPDASVSAAELLNHIHFDAVAWAVG